MVDTIMVGHLLNVPRWGGIASQEGSAINNLLRKNLKFSGVTISDDLGMDAVRPSTGALSNVITSAIKTGIDIVLIAHPVNEDTGSYVNTAIVDALVSRDLSWGEVKQSLHRIAQLKRKLPKNRPKAVHRAELNNCDDACGSCVPAFAPL
jgi:beta-N-acetylhexosaminidase